MKRNFEVGAHGQKESRRERIISALEILRLLKEADGYTIADIEGLKRLSYPRDQESAIQQKEGGKIPLEVRFDATNRAGPWDVFDALQERLVVSRDEYAEAKKEGTRPVARPLFYQPASLEDAFDPKAIKKERSYLGPWDVVRKVHWGDEMQLADGKSASLGELYLARALVKDFDVRRDEKGVLTVRNPQTGERVKPSSQFLRDYLNKISFFEEGKQKHLFSSPARMLVKYFPHVVESGLLTPEDFEVNAGHAGEVFSRERAFSGKGMARVGGARYYLGSDFSTVTHPDVNERYSVEQIAPGYGGVIEKANGELASVFKLKSSEEVAARYREQEKRLGRGEIKGSSPGLRSTARGVGAYVFFGKEDGIQLIPYRTTGWNKPLPGESHEEYAERIRSVASWLETKQFRDRLADEAMIGAHTLLSMREQEWLTTAAKRIPGGADKIIAGAKKYGRDFLRAFLSAEYGLQHGEKVLELARSARPEVMRALFRKYGEIADEADRVTDSLKELVENPEAITDEEKLSVREKLLRRAKDLFLQPRITARQLEGVKTDILLFASLFKTLKENGDVAFRDMREIEVRTLRASDMTDAERADMRELFRANHTDPWVPQALETRDFEYALKDPENEFEVISLGGNIVAFLRTREMENGDLLFASVNVAESARGFAVGSAMLETFFKEQTAKGRTLEAEVYAENPYAAEYVNRFKLVLDGFDPDFEGSGSALFHMTLQNGAEYAREFSAPGSVLRTYAFPEEKERFKEEMADFLEKKNFVVTRFLRLEKGKTVRLLLEPRASR